MPGRGRIGKQQQQQNSPSLGPTFKPSPVLNCVGEELFGDLCKFHHEATPFSPSPFGIWTPGRGFSDFFPFLYSCHMRTFGNFLPEGSLPAALSPPAGMQWQESRCTCARVHDGHSFCGVTNCHCASPPSLPPSLDADPLARPLAPFTPSIPPFATRCACAHLKVFVKHSERWGLRIRPPREFFEPRLRRVRVFFTLLVSCSSSK